MNNPRPKPEVLLLKVHEPKLQYYAQKAVEEFNRVFGEHIKIEIYNLFSADIIIGFGTVPDGQLGNNHRYKRDGINRWDITINKNIKWGWNRVLRFIGRNHPTHVILHELLHVVIGSSHFENVDWIMNPNNVNNRIKIGKEEGDAYLKYFLQYMQ